MKAINTLRRLALGATAALALVALSAPAKAEVQFYDAYQNKTVVMSNTDYAKAYAEASVTDRNGELIGVCLSTGGYNTGKCPRQMTAFELFISINGASTGGASSRGNPGPNG